MLTPLRRRLAVAAVVLAVPTLGACGFSAQTDQVYQPGVGPNDRSGRVDVLNAVVVSETDGQGTFVASLVNKDDNTDVRLTSVTAGSQSDQVTLKSPVTVSGGSLVNLADKGAVSVDGSGVTPGSYVALTLEFSDGQKNEIDTPVVARDEQFSDVTMASPSASPSSTPSPSGSPSGSPSASPTG